MTAAMNPGGQNVSVGVQELIEKLRNQGVQDGRDQADRIINEARANAAELIREAQAKADTIVSKAREEADFITKSGQEALQLAERNAVLELKDYLLEKFSGQVSALVSGSLEKEEVLKQMILEVAGENNLHGEKNLEVVLPRKVIGVDELRKNPDLVKQGPLLDFVTGQAAEMLQEGVTFSVGKTCQSGIKFRLHDKEIEVELSDTTVTAVLLRHLQPRFRALLEGIVK
ncbi:MULTISPECIES: ATPase [unclassified Endozoicomonas]|uniref:ATPase n=1 Tax=unclassified Endozoicomonas TaxID=2644528 RepID=UPI0021493022|nr:MULTISPECIES: ATPase [unclassified Endozoicomonas]